MSESCTGTVGTLSSKLKRLNGELQQLAQARAAPATFLDGAGVGGGRLGIEPAFLAIEVQILRRSRDRQVGARASGPWREREAAAQESALAAGLPRTTLRLAGAQA